MMSTAFRLLFKAICALVLALPAGALAANKTFTGAAGALFSDATRWNGGTLPAANDTLRINGECTVDAGAANLAYGPLNVGLASAGTLKFASGTTLNVTQVTSTTAGSAIDMSGGGTLQIRTSWTTTNQTFTPGAGTINWNVTGAASTLPAAIATYNNLTITANTRVVSLGVATTVNGDLTVSTGTLADAGLQITGNASGTMTVASGATLTIGTGAANTSFPTNFTAGNIALDPASTVTYQSTGAQTVSGVPTYGNLTINKTGATGTLGAATTVAGALTITAGTLSTSGSNFALSVTSNITGAGALTGNGSTISVGGNMTVTTFTAGTSTVVYNGSGAQTAGGTYTYNNLTINKSGGTATLGAAATVNGNLTITAGILADGGRQITGNATGTMSMASGTTLTIGSGATATSFPTTFAAGNITLDPASTVTYQSTAAQTIRGLSGANPYGNLTKLNAGTASLGGATDVAGALTITAGTVSTSASNFALSVTGSVTGTGTLTPNASAVTIGGDLTVTTLTAPTTTSNFTFNGSGAQQIGGAFGFRTLTINKSAGTATLGGATTVNVNLAISQGTLADGGNQITGNATGTLTMASGTSLFLGSGASNTLFPTTFTGANITLNAASTVTYQSTGAQTVSGIPTYGNLTINKTAGTGTLGANTTVAGSLTITSGTLNTSAASNFSLAVTGSITGAGTLTGNTSAISVGGDMTVTTFNAGAAPSTVTFNGSGAQQVGGAYTFRHLTINKSAGTATLGGATTVSGNLTITSGTLADGGFQLTGNGTGTMSMASGAALTLGTSANTVFPTNFTNANISLNSASTVTYQSTGAQTVSGVPTYGNLVIDKASTTGTLGAATMVAGALTISAGTLDTSGSNFSLSVTGSITGAGTLTSNASPVTVGGDMTVTTFTAPTGASNVTFNGSGAQAVGGAYTFRTLTINKSGGTATLGGATTVGVDLTITAGTLSTGSGVNLSVTGNITGAGALSGSSSAIGVGGNMTVTTFTAGTSTVQFNGTGAQTIGGAYTFANLSINKLSGTATLGGATSVSGNLTLTAGTLDDGGFQLTGNATGTLNMASGTSLSLGTAGTATAFPTAFTSGNTTLNAGSTVTYASGAAQNVSTTPTYGNLTFSGAGTKTTASGTLTIAGDWSVGSTTTLSTNSTSVTLTGSGKQINGASCGLTFTTLTVNGTNTNNCASTITVNTALSGSGTLTQGTNALLTLKGTAGITTLTATANPNTVTYNGSASQAANATTYHHLTVNNSSGITLSGDITVNGTLTLTAGKISTSSNVVIIPDGGSVTGASSARYVNGNLRMNFKSAVTSHVFDVGDASKYVPVTITFASVTTAGNLTVNATGSAHADIANSGLEPTQSASRYWTATKDGTLAFTTYSATLDYTNDPPFGGVTDFTVYGIAKADSCTPPCLWSFPTTVATTASTAQASGMTGFSDFGVGHKVDHFVFTAPSNATQNTPFSVTITAVDKNGSTVSGFTGTATIISTNGNCTISAGGTTAAFTSGAYTGNVTISNGCSDTLKAAQVGNSGVTGTSGNVTVAVLVSSFNVFETSTAANATTGQIYTKLAGTGPFGLDVVAIASGAQVNSFSDNVKIELLANSTPGSNYAANNCPNASTVVQTIASFAVSGGRSTASLSAIATAYRDIRVRVSYPTTSPTVTSCSSDSFSIRPTGFTVTSSTATNNGTSGSPAIKTGASFDLSAASVAGYDGAPSIDQTKIVGTPNAGSIGGSFSAAPSGTGTAAGSAFTYSEVGNFGLNANAVYDNASFTSLDQSTGDCINTSPNDFSNTLIGGKYGCKFGSAAIAQTTGSSGFGRFIPDNFDVTPNTPTFAASCGAFSYVGQAFNFGTAPTFTVTARNGAALGNATTQNYAGAYVKLTNSTLTPGTQAARYSVFDALGGGATPALDTSALPATTGDPAIGTFTNGVGTLTFSSGSGLGFTRSATTPNAPFNADIALAINIIDGDSVAYASNPKSFGTATSDNGISFTGGKAMRFGRLRILPATGVANLPLNVTIRAEYWTGSGFATNTLDSCTQVARANVKQSAYKAPLAACDTRISATPVTLASGVGTLRLSAPSGAHTGSVTLAPQLGATAGNFCDTVGGSEAATSSAGLGYLQGNWNGSANYDQDPSARAAFGVYGSQPRNLIFFRENY